MLDKLRSMFRASAPPAADTPADVAIAALLVEAAVADETYTDKERALIDAVLADGFKLDPGSAKDLRARGESAQKNANDLHRFTKIAKDLPASQKTALIESLWRIVLSDDERDPHEDALIRRICGLIYVSDPESAAARNRVLKDKGA